MQLFLWLLGSLAAYAVGLILIVQVTPRLLFHSYDNVWFMSFAVLDILGAFLTFGSFVVSWNGGSIGIRILDFILLVIVVLVTGRTALFCFRNYRSDVQQVSRYAAGSFCLFLSLAALFSIVLLFKP
jgi:hypothetical protein